MDDMFFTLSLPNMCQMAQIIIATSTAICHMQLLATSTSLPHLLPHKIPCHIHRLDKSTGLSHPPHCHTHCLADTHLPATSTSLPHSPSCQIHRIATSTTLPHSLSCHIHRLATYIALTHTTPCHAQRLVTFTGVLSFMARSEASTIYHSHVQGGFCRFVHNFMIPFCGHNSFFHPLVSNIFNMCALNYSYIHTKSTTPPRLVHKYCTIHYRHNISITHV